METRSFEFREGTSDKFWTISLNGANHVIRFGRNGTAGQEQNKEFPSSDAAKKAYDKLIAEKVKKGYREVGSAVTAPAPPPPPPPAPLPPEPEPEPEPVAVAPPPAAAPAASHLHLAPDDYLYVTWRPRTPRDRPAAAPWDRDDAMKRLGRVLRYRYYFQLTWDDAGMQASMSKEEARFWLRSMMMASSRSLTMNGNLPSSILTHAENIDVSVTPPIEEIAKQISPDIFSNATLVPLYHLYPWKDVCRLLANLDTTQLRYIPIRPPEHAFRLLLLPYLSEAELAQLREGVIDALDQHRSNRILRELVPLIGIHDYLGRMLKILGPRFPEQYVFGLGDPALIAAEVKSRNIVLRTPEMVTAWIAHTGLDHLDWVGESIVQNQDRESAEACTAHYARLVTAPAAAREFLRALEQTRGSLAAKAWFEQNAQAALEGLEAERTGASGRAMIQTLRRKLGLETGEVVKPVLEQLPDGLAAAFATVRKQRLKPPKWLSASELPRIDVAGGVLPDADVNLLLAVLSSADPRPPHPLLLALRCYATPDSLDAFAEALFQTWRQSGMAGKEKWALLAMGSIGSDRSALRIAPYVREWPGEAKHQAAVWGLEVLRGIATDTAIMQINLLAQKAKFQALKKNAQETMEQIAEDRGMTRDELEDRIVPDCGLDERGSRVFDFGPRQFRLRIGPNMKPSIVDGDNVRRDDLPNPTQKDDAALAEAAVSQWKLVKKQVSEVVKVQIARLENALVTQRRWTPADFETLLVRHPLLGQLVRPLVWGVFDEKNNLLSTFRVTEELQYASVEDDEFPLPGEGLIGLPHPAKLDAQTMAAWGEVLSDYELIPPFPQLGRKVYQLAPEELTRREIVRHEGVTLQPVVFAGILKRLGYMHGDVQDGGSYHTHTKWFPTVKLTAVMHHTWLSIGYYETDPVSVEKVYFVPRAYERGNWAEEHEGKLRLADVDPVIVSEILADLHVLASRAGTEEK